MCKTLFSLCFTLAVVLTSAEGAAGEWGHLRARFTYDGPAPAQLPASITSDRDFCCKHVVLQENLVVNPRNKGLANVVISLDQGRGDPPPPIHESYAATANANVRLDNDKCRFDPHVVLLRTTQTIVLGNKDPIGHNTKIDTFDNPSINPIIPALGELRHQFPKPEQRLPACRVSCSIHPWMSGWVVIRDHPYFAVTDGDGRMEIRNLPAGTWTFRVWHETAGFIDQVGQGGESVSWPRGRFEIEIKPEGVDLGELSVSPSLFEK